jgi:hypothetical protein
MSNGDIDYEDLTSMRLEDAAVADMLAAGGECIFNWTTREGYPVGVVVAFVHRDGKFFTTCAERRKRVPALRTRRAKRPASEVTRSCTHPATTTLTNSRRGSTRRCRDWTVLRTTRTVRASPGSWIHHTA